MYLPSGAGVDPRLDGSGLVVLALAGVLQHGELREEDEENRQAEQRQHLQRRRVRKSEATKRKKEATH